MRSLIIALLLFAHIEAKTICLNMIVKNESKVIQRCLESVKGTIDYWVIVDTGSTDGTQQLIKECLKDIPGELHERPWVDLSITGMRRSSTQKRKAITSSLWMPMSGSSVHKSSPF